MRVNLLAKRYADAVFELAVETKNVDRIAEDIKLVYKVLDENRLLRKIMDNPVIDASKKINILNKIFGEKVNDLSIRFLRLITRKGREMYIMGICEAFEDNYLDYKNIVRAELVTAYATDKEIRESVLAKLKTISNKDIMLSETVNEDIIGGFIMRIEDYQLDASVANQLKRLSKNFASNLYEKQF
ncbi:MAG: ATP synthase F1 subunit delta [Bacteroidales bacterium]|nr:ATP synthase F1 subunit delta [Bacteroidales bacterium]